MQARGNRAWTLRLRRGSTTGCESPVRLAQMSVQWRVHRSLAAGSNTAMLVAGNQALRRAAAVRQRWAVMCGSTSIMILTHAANGAQKASQLHTQLHRLTHIHGQQRGFALASRAHAPAVCPCNRQHGRTRDGWGHHRLQHGYCWSHGQHPSRLEHAAMESLVLRRLPLALGTSEACSCRPGWQHKAPAVVPQQPVQQQQLGRLPGDLLMTCPAWYGYAQVCINLRGVRPATSPGACSGPLAKPSRSVLLANSAQMRIVDQFITNGSAPQRCTSPLLR